MMTSTSSAVRPEDASAARSCSGLSIAQKTPWIRLYQSENYRMASPIVGV